MMYLDGGKVSSRVYYNRTGYMSLYGIAAAFGFNSVYGATITAGAAASGLGLPLAMFTGVTAGYQAYMASQFASAGSQAEIYFSRHGKYRVTITSLFGVITGVKAERG
ncbi:hypothetical protein [Anaerobranca gottschalkii]|uniref:Uncharacterized protein n=1 Tax=Anaerobranca gottschalkii DSM 13577 TaxID=1120990 RepID=A0A1I0BA28_9FIRM|nr:hypothetical protein [Anaerobranca gottschalkii]SET03273.1 hypothetical protein SAMN03080614_103418 [Anaerobranca gottschalkii DSM 13577]